MSEDQFLLTCRYFTTTRGMWVKNNIITFYQTFYFSNILDTAYITPLYSEYCNIIGGLKGLGKCLPIGPELGYSIRPHRLSG